MEEKISNNKLFCYKEQNIKEALLILNTIPVVGTKNCKNILLINEILCNPNIIKKGNN